MPRIANNINGIVGYVPTVRLNRIHPICAEQELFLKLESCNPGGSIKEKNAVYLIQKAVERGHLKPGGTIIESSSGNFGIALAMVGAALGYSVTIVVDVKTPLFTKRILQAHGAQLVELTLEYADAYGSMQIARTLIAEELVKTTPGAWSPYQHKNPENPLAHFEFTAKEIINDFGGNAPDAVVIGLGVLGQLTGIGQFFRTYFPSTELIAADVAGSAILGLPAYPYKTNGLGLTYTPSHFNPDYINEAYSVTDTLAFSMCRLLARKEGLLLGSSTGSIVSAGLSYACRQTSRKKILMINPDRGDRYLDTVYNDEWIEKKNLVLLDEIQCAESIKLLHPLKDECFRSLKQAP